jgi:hypothetical protein
VQLILVITPRADGAPGRVAGAAVLKQVMQRHDPPIGSHPAQHPRRVVAGHVQGRVTRCQRQAVQVPTRYLDHAG